MRQFCISAALAAALGVLAAPRSFTSFNSVKAILNEERERLPAELRSPNVAKWTAWSQRRDKAIRERLDQGDLDSMVNLLLFGTSFTKQPRIKVEGLTEATKAGTLRARVDDLVAGLRNPADNERLVFLNGLLRSKGIDPAVPGETGVFIYSNLQRVLMERQVLAERAAHADPVSALDRQSLFSDRGVSLDTSILPNFSIDQTLLDLKKRGLLREGQVTRVAVIGPGLDFIDKNEESGYDYYPQQTLQPFALYDSLVRLGLAKDGAVAMSIFDISSRVIDHLQRARDRAKKSAGYVIQLPRDVSRPWPPELVAYWKALGDRAGTAVAPIRPPELFKGLETRAVRIRPQVVLACEPEDLNIVLERRESGRFDLMVGTNIFLYYSAFEQTLALENAGAMLKAGGLLLTNDRLPEVAGGSMRQVGETEAPYTHDVVGWYQRR